MLSSKKEYSKEDIAGIINERIADMGITQEELNREVMGTSLNELICTVVSEVVATVKALEKEELRQRQREGMRRAQEQGVTLGRPCKRSDARFERLLARYDNGEITGEEAARRMQVSISTFYRWLRQSRAAEASKSVDEDAEN